MNKIYLDNIIFSLQRTGGISVVWYEHLVRLIREKSFRLEFLEYEGAANLFRDGLSLPACLVTTGKSTLLSTKRYLNPTLRREKRPFVFHSSYYRYCKNPKAINITTVHDFTYEYFGKGIRKRIHCWQKYRAIRHSEYIICISENTKKDLLRFLPDVDERKISVIYNGVSKEYAPLADVAENLLPFPEFSYVLFVGAREGYKNFDLAVRTVRETGLNLVIAGNPLQAQEERFLNRELGEARYRSLGRISNQELNRLYNRAYCLLYLSAYEGFGIPVIEAQSASCPVVAYDASSVSEIIGAPSLLVSELTVEAVKTKLRSLSNPKIRQEIVCAGLANARRFSWDKTYKETRALYQKALALTGK